VEEMPIEEVVLCVSGEVFDSKRRKLWEELDGNVASMKGRKKRDLKKRDLANELSQ
jgi:hypothetical protein